MMRPSIVSALATAILVTPVQSQERRSFVAEVAVSEQEVAFKTTGRFVGFRVEVFGPNHYSYSREYSGTDTPVVGTKTDRGTLADGRYTIEVTAQPEIPVAARGAMERARARGDRNETRRLMDEAGMRRSALVHSIVVTVEKGQFVDRNAREPTESARGEGQASLEAALGAGTPQEAPSTPVRTAGDPTNRPLPVDHVASPDVTATSLASRMESSRIADLSRFLANPSDGTWREARFQNVLPDGSVTLFHGYVRRVAFDDFEHGPGYVAFFRTAAVDGHESGRWHRGVFETTGNGFRLRNVVATDPLPVAPAESLFDYVVTDDDSPATDYASERVVFHTGSGSIQGSLCVGNDCPSNPNFGFDTQRFQENNLRVHFDDTSTILSFPRNDWRIITNDSANGGGAYWAVEDATAGRQVLRVNAGARANALFVDAQGDVGLGTSTPALDIDIKTGDTPSVRLQQDASSGFAPQTWDVAGNEVGFFIRDATSGSRLPLRIRVGAPSSSIDIASTGNVGIGTTSPDAPVHVRRTDQTALVHVEDASTASGNQLMLHLEKAQSAPIARFESSFRTWDFTGGNSFTINDPADAAVEMTVNAAGDLTITGQITTTGPTCMSGCDEVLHPNFDLPSIEQHAAEMKAKGFLPAVGPTLAGAPINLTEKTGGILNELEKAHLYIEQLHARVRQLEGIVAELVKVVER